MTRSLAVVLSVFLLSSCKVSCQMGSKGKLDPSKGEALVKESLEAEGGVVKSVACPEDVETKKGVRFVCDVTAENGDLLKYEYEQTDDRAGVKLIHRDQLVIMAKVEASIQALLDADNLVKKLDLGPVACPPDKRAVKGSRFECSASSKTQRLVVGVEELDDGGNIRYGIVRLEADPQLVAKRVIESLKQQRIVADVDCGKKTVPLKDKQVVSCVATVEGRTTKVEILPKGNTGDFSWRIAADKQ